MDVVYVAGARSSSVNIPLIIGPIWAWGIYDGDDKIGPMVYLEGP